MPSNAKVAVRKCPKCRYNLAGLAHNTCPECGTSFDEGGLLRRQRRRRWLVSLITMALVMYAPYCWLVLIDYPWGSYRWSWVSMWPGLPLLIVAHLVRQVVGDFDLDGTLARVMLPALSVGLLIALSWLGARRWWALLAVALIVLLLSIVNSIGAYGAFSM